MAELEPSVVAEIVKLRRQGFSTREVGKKLDISPSTVSNYSRAYDPECGNVRGEAPPTSKIGRAIDRTDIDGSVELLKIERPATVEELMSLCKLDPHVWIPQFYNSNCWQGFYKLRTEKGHKKVQLYQSKATFKRVISEELEHAILRFIRKNIKPLPKPKLTNIKAKGKGFMVAWGLWDAHLGMYAWNQEVGTDYDVKTGINRIKNSVDDMIVELSNYNIEKIIMPIGNDFMHFDSVRHTTTFGEHFLDTDTRYAKVYASGLECLVYMIERALEISPEVNLLYVPGNHDVTSSFTLCAALDQRFKNDSRVKSDLSMNPRKYVTFGGTLLGFDHGREAKPEQLVTIFSTETKDVWSESTYRELQIGDKHQRWEKIYQGVIPTNGILIRRNPCLCNVDAWHHRKGLVGEPVKSVEAWRYDRIGYRGSHVAWARDKRN